MVDADSVKAIILDELSKPSLASWIGGPVEIRILRKYRDWKKHNDMFAPARLDARLCFSRLWFIL